ncbi:hypothetical protein EV360DRAFT_75184 [Lentinula raphanica]|nr:hypothetical protein EV360DRAFT_75184 [Lentinula raphanica]
MGSTATYSWRAMMAKTMGKRKVTTTTMQYSNDIPSWRGRCQITPLLTLPLHKQRRAGSKQWKLDERLQASIGRFPVQIESVAFHLGFSNFLKTLNFNHNEVESRNVVLTKCTLTNSHLHANPNLGIPNQPASPLPLHLGQMNSFSYEIQDFEEELGGDDEMVPLLWIQARAESAEGGNLEIDENASGCDNPSDLPSHPVELEWIPAQYTLTLLPPTRSLPISPSSRSCPCKLADAVRAGDSLPAVENLVGFRQIFWSGQVELGGKGIIDRRLLVDDQCRIYISWGQGGLDDGLRWSRMSP